ncbi:hypothetical protein M3Y96_01097400 [Aphelenchoides besseyi]|nr:hypothetical protein M3Y96_01097400 [Aphelenchoides besseyi]KAI6196810.1 hypothetical protein M3Y94_01153000 [Aphelenchoides besseyi]KAI6227983.1 hypothetical protein M3Y95_00574400 [Aphelenchoides besseyi]
MPRSAAQLNLRLPSEDHSVEPLEDTEPGDSDRRIDNCSFRRAQFDIFKQRFRDAFDEHGHETLANLTLDGNLKKEVVNTLRKLQRAKFSLEQLPSCPEISELIAKFSEIYNELSISSKGDREFTVDNVQLPEYDEDAIHLFFGDDEQPKTEKTDVLKQLSDFNKQFTEKINEILGASQLLLNEYDELMAFVKRGGAPAESH